ncbi:MAG TPA: D-alanyl-D-alanine carboxypeptidase [Thermomicrobiaceae bacterium]|nr:D-alanyl-D-alanine carboxypeptidase [Thermomicrobiaceae bacterium]
MALVLVGLTARAYLDGRAAAKSASPATPPVALVRVAPATPVATPAVPLNLTLSARAAILVDARTGLVLYQHNADLPLAPASTTKIVNALTALRLVDPEQVVTIQPQDLVNRLVDSNMGLEAGDVVTVHDLLVGMFLPSGDDAAKALARFAGEQLPGSGTSTQRFVDAMNAEAARLGMRGSHFIQPAGLDVPGQVVTARGLALATRALLANPTLLPIVAMPSANVRVGGPHARVISLTNTNELLSQEGVYGVKTGTTPLAGECLIVAYRSPTGPEIAVILDSQHRYADARALLGLPPAGH